MTLDHVITLDKAREILSATEPMDAVRFSVGTGIRFTARQGWNHGLKAKDPAEPVPVYAHLGDQDQSGYALTKATVEELGLTIGLRREYVGICPADLLVPQLNYWFREGLATLPRKQQDYQFLTTGGTAFAFMQQRVKPISNLMLLEQMVKATTERFGGRETPLDIWVDARMSHTLRQTSIRLILPQVHFTIGDDQWSLGLSLRNSLTGQSSTSIDGYLYHQAGRFGLIDATAKSAPITRRKDATDDEIHAWVADAVDEAFNGQNDTIGYLHRAAEHELDRLSVVLRDIFEHYRVSLQHRQRIIERVEEAQAVSIYTIINAVAETATDDGLEPSAVDHLMRIAGDLPYSTDERCGADNPCGRVVHSH